MRDLDLLRGAIERAARRSLGINPVGFRMSEVDARTADLQAMIARLPVNVDDLNPIQDMDPMSPTHGEAFAMVGISVVGGPDPIT